MKKKIDYLGGDKEAFVSNGDVCVNVTDYVIDFKRHRSVTVDNMSFRCESDFFIDAIVKGDVAMLKGKTRNLYIRVLNEYDTIDRYRQLRTLKKEGCPINDADGDECYVLTDTNNEVGHIAYTDGTIFRVSDLGLFNKEISFSKVCNFQDKDIKRTSDNIYKYDDIVCVCEGYKFFTREDCDCVYVGRGVSTAKPCISIERMQGRTPRWRTVMDSDEVMTDDCGNEVHVIVTDGAMHIAYDDGVLVVVLWAAGDDLSTSIAAKLAIGKGGDKE